MRAAVEISSGIAWMLNFGSFMFASWLGWQFQVRPEYSARTIRFLRSMLRAAECIGTARNVETLDWRREMVRLLVSNADVEFRAVPEIWR